MNDFLFVVLHCLLYVCLVLLPFMLQSYAGWTTPIKFPCCCVLAICHFEVTSKYRCSQWIFATFTFFSMEYLFPIYGLQCSSLLSSPCERRQLWRIFHLLGQLVWYQCKIYRIAAYPSYRIGGR